MEGYWDVASMFSTYTMGRYKKETAEELEKQLVQLKKDVDRQMEMSLIDRLIYSYQHSMVILEEDIESQEKVIHDLTQTTGAGSELFRLHIVIFKSRLESSKARLEKYKSRLAECVQQLKDYNFSVRRKELDEDIAEAKKREALEAEEAKKAQAEAEGNPQIA